MINRMHEDRLLCTTRTYKPYGKRSVGRTRRKMFPEEADLLNPWSGEENGSIFCRTHSPIFLSENS